MFTFSTLKKWELQAPWCIPECQKGNSEVGNRTQTWQSMFYCRRKGSPPLWRFLTWSRSSSSWEFPRPLFEQSTWPCRPLPFARRRPCCRRWSSGTTRCPSPPSPRRSSCRCASGSAARAVGQPRSPQIYSRKHSRYSRKYLKITLKSLKKYSKIAPKICEEIFEEHLECDLVLPNPLQLLHLQHVRDRGVHFHWDLVYIWYYFLFFIEFRVKTVLIPSSRFPSVFSKGSGAISIVYESLGWVGSDEFKSKAIEKSTTWLWPQNMG